MKRKLATSSWRVSRSRSGSRRAALIALGAICTALAAASPSAADPTAAGPPFDGSGTPAGSMVPTKLAVDQSTGSVYIIDAGHDVVDKFSSSGVYQSQIRGSDTTAGSFSFGAQSSDAIAIDPTTGDVYVVSESGGLIFKFDSSGAERWERSSISGDTCGVGVDPSGNPWVADYNAQALTQLRPSDGGATGTTISTGPQAPCEISFNSSGDVFVANWQSNLDKWDAAGNDVAQCQASGLTFDVAIDPLTDSVFAVVQDAGARLVQWDSSCNGLSSVAFPFLGFTNFPGVAVNGALRKVYASEADLGVVQIYNLTPTVVPLAVSNLVIHGSTLNGTVNPEGAPVTDCHFEVSTSASFTPATSLPCIPSDVGTGTTPVSVSADVSGLTANTLYHSRLVATNAGGPAETGDVTFRTRAQPVPTVRTGAASAVTQTGATLAGTANPNGDATTCKFQYGTTSSYGSEIATASPGSGSGDVAVNANVTGLAAGTLYHFRLACTNGGGASNGADATFTTQAAPTCATDASLCPPPPPPPSRTCLTDASLCRTTLAVVSGLRVACAGDAGGACRDTLVFRARVKYKVKRGRRTVTKTRTITVGRAAVDLAVGGSTTLKVSLTSAAKSALKKSALSATADGLEGAIKLPKTKARRPKHKRK